MFQQHNLNLVQSHPTRCSQKAKDPIKEYIPLHQNAFITKWKKYLSILKAYDFKCAYKRLAQYTHILNFALKDEEAEKNTQTCLYENIRETNKTYATNKILHHYNPNVLDKVTNTSNIFSNLKYMSIIYLLDIIVEQTQNKNIRCQISLSSHFGCVL